MSKKLLIVGLVLALAAALTAPAAAGKKKKKGPKPYTSEEVTVQIGHPVFNGASGSVVGVTPQEFLQTCSLPSTNGLDAYVFEVPKPYQKIQASIDATGSAQGIDHDIDIYLFDSSCAPVGTFNAAGTDESGVLSAGTAFILLHNYIGGPTTMQFTLKPY